jgi:hypothetical protein
VVSLVAATEQKRHQIPAGSADGRRRAEAALRLAGEALDEGGGAPGVEESVAFETRLVVVDPWQVVPESQQARSTLLGGEPEELAVEGVCLGAQVAVEWPVTAGDEQVSGLGDLEASAPARFHRPFRAPELQPGFAGEDGIRDVEDRAGQRQVPAAVADGQERRHPRRQSRDGFALWPDPDGGGGGLGRRRGRGAHPTILY